MLAALLLSTPARASELTVFAAASLTDALTELGQNFDAQTGHHTTFQFASSKVLRTQIQEGAAPDVYASASSAQFESLAGLVGRAQPFASNLLAVIVRKSPPKKSQAVSTLRDLVKPGLRIVTADKAVPLGDYTRRMLRVLDQSGAYGQNFMGRFMRNVVSQEPSARQVSLKVQLGEADAAVVYRSDITPALRSQVREVALPSRFNQRVSYPIGVLRASPNAKAAQAFVHYVLSAEGQSVLRKWGFLKP